MLNYEEYKLLMNRQLKKKDVRERVFQDNVIRPFLQVLLTDYDIEPVDVKINSSEQDRKSTRLNSSHIEESRMPSSA